MSTLSQKVCSVEACDRKQHARGWCHKHYCRVLRYGSPDGGFFTRDPIERFWRNVEKGAEDECWLWTGLATEDGYGRISVDGAYMGAHRFSYELHREAIPVGKQACHSCDNPPCVNPAHLWLGTQAENMRDMARKGRANLTPAMVGEKHTNAKLNRDEVIAIRRLKREKGLTHAELANMYGVCFQLISKIVLRKAWTHVE